MKQLHFKTSKGEFLLFETHEGAYDVRYEYPSIIYEIDKKNEGITRIGFGTRHDLELIGNIENLTDGDKWDVVEPSSGGEYFKNYEEYGYEYATASESFDSLLKSLGVHFENPLGDEPDNFVTPYTDMFTVAKRFKKHLEWQQAQSKVWDKENTYLFKKI